MDIEQDKNRKLPPLEKIAEAYSVIADNRIKDEGNDVFLITSSNGEKIYKVMSDGKRYRSNDNATKFARYAGYPVLAVLMYKGILPLPEKRIDDFKDINWNAINKKYKRDYAAALDAALSEKKLTTEQINEIKKEMRKCYDIFLTHDIKV